MAGIAPKAEGQCPCHRPARRDHGAGESDEQHRRTHNGDQQLIGRVPSSCTRGADSCQRQPKNTGCRSRRDRRRPGEIVDVVAGDRAGVGVSVETADENGDVSGHAMSFSDCVRSGWVILCVRSPSSRRGPRDHAESSGVAAGPCPLHATLSFLRSFPRVARF